jgi:glycosyltransferase involved in cell wall biosynthesis
MVVAEAFAFGKPVIASNRGGIPEMVRDGENGLLFDPGEPSTLLLGLDKVIRDSRLRETLGRVAQESATPYLDVGQWARTYADLYAELINSHDHIASAVL